jgi:hypothetical protein
MKDYPWDYIEWILENSSQCGIGGGHGGEEDYFSYIVFFCPMLEDFTGLGLCFLFMCFIKYKDFPLCTACTLYPFFCSYRMF